ncbi:hypothetical protein K435DRAFT_316771 [Dendrothele bispora CBS 962.96]|uniref:Uncharacterized protein n=1 Tax=Dendrothele bispora (strain CBS 962.96) TaxID=1314807 RepID=A0A4S8LH98_DENBC|nr:hypothetical protein K435DRAFT_316771 [Dendrothele bispora CBS 962.96]
MSDRISYDQFWSHSLAKCCHCGYRRIKDLFRFVHVDCIWLSAAWLSQAQYFCDTVNGLYEDIPKSAALADKVSFSLQPKSHENHHSYLHPKFCQIFLFIAPITASHPSETSGIDVCWGNDDNDLYYWSFDSDGSGPLSKRVTEVLGLPELIPKARVDTSKFEDYQYEATKQFQLFRGYNPSTQEFAQRHRLPLVDIIWPDSTTGPDKDGDIWYDCQETQDKESDHSCETPHPSMFSAFGIISNFFLTWLQT